jgi:ribosome maturation factor RimP
MLEKNQLDRLIETEIKIELSNKTYLRGILKEVTNNSIVLEFLDKRKMIISLSQIEFVKQVKNGDST